MKRRNAARYAAKSPPYSRTMRLIAEMIRSSAVGFSIFGMSSCCVAILSATSTIEVRQCCALLQGEQWSGRRKGAPTRRVGHRGKATDARRGPKTRKKSFQNVCFSALSERSPACSREKRIARSRTSFQLKVRHSRGFLCTAPPLPSRQNFRRLCAIFSPERTPRSSRRRHSTRAGRCRGRRRRRAFHRRSRRRIP